VIGGSHPRKKEVERRTKMGRRGMGGREEDKDEEEEGRMGE
jgi:hypothetical protein